jgi:hypothetical protein
VTLESRAGGAVVHFGMPKTGTTSIQESLFRRLSDPRFYYVNLGRSNASIPIATAFKGNAAQFHFHVKAGTAAGELAQLKADIVERLGAELRSAGERTAILSGEAIFGLKPPELRELCCVVARHRHGAVTAAGYVRRPKEFMESEFQQQVKSGHRAFRVPKVPRYRGRVGKFDTVFGRDNVRVWLFDPSTFAGGCVVQDFCSRLGARFRAQDVTRTNESLSRPALSLLFAYRKFGPGYGVGAAAIQENRLLIRRIMTLPGIKARLHSSLVAPLLGARREDIEWMEARAGASLAEDLAAHDDGAIRSEADLLEFAPESLQWLAEQLGGPYARQWHPAMQPPQVAEWVHELRLRLGRQQPAGAA